jgi:hypothetical protein
VAGLNRIKSSSELMEVKMDFDIFSDLYKDVHGVRPRGIVATPELIRSLQQDLMVQNTVWFAEQSEALAKVLAVGAPSEADADRWLEQAEGY